ncbi:MAG: hypothetical protein AB8B56_18940 [Crocinitomicaceae bacterium]
MNIETISILGLTLSLAPAVVHAIEVIKPTWVRWVVNLVLPLFAPGLPNKQKSINEKDQLHMLDAAIAAAPAAKKTAAKDYIFIMLFEQRQGALAFISMSVAAIYAMSLPLPERHIIHLMFLIMSALFLLVDANQAGIPFLGHHPRVTKNGRNVCIVFCLLWIASTVMNYLAFNASCT